MGKPVNGQCQCGQASFSLNAKPLLRVICHCEICQAFNEADYADIVIYDTKGVDMPEEGQVNYKSYANPPMLLRGKCAVCNKPAIEYIDYPLAPKLTIVPTKNIDDQSSVPEPAFHSFYHRRKKDWEDEKPKYEGYLKSQLVFMKELVKARMRS